MAALIVWSVAIHAMCGAARTAAPDAAPVTRPAAADTRVTVAVLDFECSTPGNPDLGKQVSEMIVDAMGGDPGIRLMTRTSMTDILAEHAISLTGVADPAGAVKIGQLLGAKILITGRIFALDSKVYYLARLIGTETSLIEPVGISGLKDAESGDLMLKLANDIAKRLHEAGPKLLAADQSVLDPMPALKAKFAGRKLPRVGVNLSERRGPNGQDQRLDPAVETALKKTLMDAGFSVFDGAGRDLERAGVELEFNGECFSESSGKIGTLVSCSGHMAVKAVSRKDGQVVFTDEVTLRAVDLAENTAGRIALEKCGREMAIRFLQTYAVKSAPPEPAAADGEGKKKKKKKAIE